tara:strand:+ start:156 stop:869 length:714 start_codon:yes stop_codon:yes gene_type:complete
MSQHDLDIANQTASAARADINLALKALVSTNSGSSAPATTYANMLWYDTSANILKIRAEADDAWISIGYLDQAADAFSVFNDTKLVNTSGTQVGLLGDQATATWQGGTGTLDSLVSPANVKAAILALVPTAASPIGVSQSWASVTRASGTSFQNTTGKPIQVSAALKVTNDGNVVFGTAAFQVSSNNSTWVELGELVGRANEIKYMALTAIVPDDHYYRWVQTGSASYSFATFTILS